MSPNNALVQLPELIERFRSLALEEAAAQSRGEYNIVNRISDEIGAAFRSILTFGDAGRNALIELVDDSDNQVALWASVYSLRHDPERCKSVLRRLSSEPSLLGFAARQSIVNWDAGKWALEPGFAPQINDKMPQVAETGLAPPGLSANEFINELAKRDDELGEMARGMQRRADMTDEELVAMMIEREDNERRQRQSRRRARVESASHFCRKITRWFRL